MKKLKCSEFEERVLQSKKPVVVLFSNEWSGSAIIVEGALKEIEKEYQGRVYFFEMMQSECTGISSSYGIAHVPAILVFKEGEVVEEIKGVPAKSTLRDKLSVI